MGDLFELLSNFLDLAGPGEERTPAHRRRRILRLSLLVAILAVLVVAVLVGLPRLSS